MTEAEWLAWDKPASMLEFLRGKVSDRKLRLFSVAGWLAGRGSYDPVHLELMYRHADGGSRRWKPTPGGIALSAWEAAYHHALQGLEALSSITWKQGDYQPGFLIMSIFGNPFRPVDGRPGLAHVNFRRGFGPRDLRQSRDFAAMPILANALQDAGCDDADVLAHCRGDGPARPAGAGSWTSSSARRNRVGKSPEGRQLLAQGVSPRLMLSPLRCSATRTPLTRACRPRLPAPLRG